MCRCQRTCDLRGDIERLTDIQRTFSHALAQGLAVDELSRNEMTCIAFVNFMDRENVRMIERGDRLGLLHKAAHAIVV